MLIVKYVTDSQIALFIIILIERAAIKERRAKNYNARKLTNWN